MKLKIEKKELEKLVGVTGKATAGQTTKQILKAVLLETTGNGLRATGNDLSIGIRKYVDAEIEEAGRIAVDAKMLGDIVKKLPEDVVKVQTDSGVLKISSKKIKFQLHLMDESQFPDWPLETEMQEEFSVIIEQSKLKDAINKVIFAVDEGGNNIAMGNVNFIITPQNVIMTALDGRRIARKSVPVKSGTVKEDQSQIIQTKMLREIVKSLSAGEAKLSFTKRHILVELADKKEEYESILIDEKFFDIDSMIPKAPQRTLRFNKQELVDVTDRSTLLFSSSSLNPLVFNINADGFVQIGIKGVLGNMEEELEVEDSNFQECLIGVNPIYLLASLRNIDDEDVVLEIAGSVQPIIIRGEDFVYLILPVKMK